MGATPEPTRRLFGLSTAAVLGAQVALGCSTSAPSVESPLSDSVAPSRTPEGDSKEKPLPIEVDDARAFEDPRIVERVRASEHQFFRLTARNFAERVCKLYGEESSPPALLHGDAHAEQFAVVKHGHGIADYDHAGVGPAVIDLVRFSTSLRVVSSQRKWEAQSDEAVTRFLAGYVKALASPDQKRLRPAFVGKCLSEFTNDRSQFLRDAEELMAPISEDEEKRLKEAFGEYRAKVRTLWPSIPEGFLEMKRAGRGLGGVGSSTARKYLMRVEGPSKDDEDDVILEAKPAQTALDSSCMDPANGEAARRVVDAQRSIFGPPPALLQVASSGETTNLLSGYYIQPWFANFRELDANKEPETFRELLEIAEAVGQQLGKGHFPQGAKEARGKQLSWVNEHRDQLVSDSREMARAVNAGWKSTIESLETKNAADDQ